MIRSPRGALLVDTIVGDGFREGTKGLLAAATAAAVIINRVCKNTARSKRSKGQGQQNKHRRFLERSNEVTPFHPASRLKSSGRKFVHPAGKT